jgi:copper(I)-binding protein
MKSLVLATGLVLALGAEVWAGEAGMAKVGDIMIEGGWARASIGKAPNSAAYMTVMTQGDAPDQLIGAATPIADAADLHTHIMDGDVAKMRPVEAIEVTPDQPAVLEPGGFHIMLMGLKQPLHEGDAFPLTLTFKNAGEVTLDVPIHGLGGNMKHEKKHQHGS